MRTWSTFGARTSHRQTRTHKIHKTHHGPDLKEAITFPPIIFSVLGHGAYTQMSFCSRTLNLGVPRFPKLGLSRLWRPITLCADLWLRWGLKKSFSPRQDLSNDMSHATWMQVNQGDFWLLVVGNQVGNLIPGLSFGHNLCFKYPNGSCKPILNIYIPRAFQWYMELFNPMSFDPCNCPLKNRKSIGTPTSKVGAHLGVWGFIPSHFSTLPGAWNVTLELHSWPAPLQTLILVVSLKLGLRHKYPNL
jgi:hypothetical protein